MMAQMMKFEDNFNDYINNTDRKIVLYGTGTVGETAYPYIPNISYVCDKKADGCLEFYGMKVLSLDELLSLREKYIIVICIRNYEICKAVYQDIEKADLDALVFAFYDNVAFRCYHELTYKKSEKEIEYVKLVCQESGWILEKFALRMKEGLEKKGIRAEIGPNVDLAADINHHIAFHIYEPISDARDTLMITHVDSLNKVNQLKAQLEVARIGICMSRETMNYLVSCGIQREKLCYINPAQDGVIKPKKYVLGITHRNYDSMDKRKRISALVDICQQIDPDYFKFMIMGMGWEDVVEQLRKMKFEIDYFPDFDYVTYGKLISSLDYYLFWGFDEGSMGYLDALAAGVGTIVTPQGFHLDVPNGITYPCRVISDFVNVLVDLQNKRKRIVNSVSEWNWDRYVDKHLEVWKYLLGNEEDIYINKHKYEDGIFSVLNVNA